MVQISRIKSVEEADLESINLLLAQQSPGKQDRNITKGEMEEIVSNRNFYLLVARDSNKKCIGMGTIFFQRNLARWIAEIHDIVVNETERGNGYGEEIARALMNVALEFSKVKECKLKLFLTSRPTRVAANALYQKLGFVLVAKSNGEWGTNLYKIIVEPTGFRNFSK